MFNKKPIIEITENGPILIQYKKLTLSLTGKTTHHSSIALCRCGASKTKPLCDGSHVSIEFKADKGTIQY